MKQVLGDIVSDKGTIFTLRNGKLRYECEILGVDYRQRYDSFLLFNLSNVMMYLHFRDLHTSNASTSLKKPQIDVFQRKKYLHKLVGCTNKLDQSLKTVTN